MNLIAESNLILNVDASKMDYSDANIAKSVVDILEKYDMTQRSFFVISNEKARKYFNYRK